MPTSQHSQASLALDSRTHQLRLVSNAIEIIDAAEIARLELRLAYRFDEVEAHLQTFADDPLVQAIIGTGAFAGLRLGEIRGKLRRTQISVKSPQFDRVAKVL